MPMMYSGQAINNAVPSADARSWCGLTAVTHSTVVSQITVTDTVSGRNRRTCIGCTNFQLVSWVSANATHANVVTHGLRCSK